MPSAADISIEETIALLESEFKAFADGFEAGMYALWLGSAISRDRVVGLDGVLSKLLESLRQRITASEDCPHRKAFNEILAMAELSAEQLADIDLTVAASQWPCLPILLSRLWNKYSKVLGVEVQGKDKLDYLLWDVLDFKNTFASQEPDAEHLAIGMLVLEGLVCELATANWDALLEAALVELGWTEDFYHIAVKGDDLQGPVGNANLYKFHGCAKRAITSESEYRHLLVARESAINQWSANPEFEEIRAQLKALTSRSRTLMIGMSAQDTNIQGLLGSKKWKLADTPTPIIFSEQELTAGQKSILEGAYHTEYEVNREKICTAAKLPVFSKALLSALLLMSISRKIEVLANKVDAPKLDHAGKQMLMEGIKELRKQAAIHGNADRYGFVQTIARLMGRYTEQFMRGRSERGNRPYNPVHFKPTHLMAKDPGLLNTGQTQVAAALGVIGLEVLGSAWQVSIDDPREVTSGALRIRAQEADARIFFAFSDDKIIGLIQSGAFNPDDPDAVVICSGNVTQPQQRSPYAKHRDGRVAARYLSMEEILGDAASLDDFRDRFIAEVGL